MAKSAKDFGPLLAPLGDRQPALRDLLLGIGGGALARVALAAGETLFAEGSEPEALHVVAEGVLRATTRGPDGAELTLSDPGPGDVIGELSLLVGGPHGATVRALTDAVLVRVPRDAVDRLAEENPEFLRGLAATVRRRLSRDQLAAVLPGLFGRLDGEVLRDVEARAGWIQAKGGEVLFSEGDPPDSIYVVLSGRLRAESGGTTLGEMGRGETIGEIGILSGEPRSATVRAIRDSELLRLPREAFDAVADRYPQVLRTVAGTVVRRLRRRERGGPAVRSSRVFAVLPLGGVSADETAAGIAGALAALGETLLLDPKRVDEGLGRPGLAAAPEDDPRGIRLEAWLDEQESRHRFLVHVTDGTDSPWTRRSLRQADAILLVADADGDPAPRPVERALLPDSRLATRSLVLRHRTGDRLPTGTGRWRTGRRLDAAYHLRGDRPADFGRIARCLAGEAVGLVLGGGGARGLAHIGVLRALEEANVPVDRIGGTSMGAVISGMYSMGMDLAEIERVNRDVWLNRKVHKEYSLPLISLIRSRRIDRMAKSIYGDADIEDLWLPWFCISCNLTTSSEQIHERGPLWQAVRASASLPGVFVPVLSGGQVLVDGGIVNNLPGDVMRARACRTVIVVHVGSETEFAVSVPEFPSPWQFLWSRVLPGRTPIKVPHIGSVIMRTTEVSSEPKTEEVKHSADLVLRPPIAQYGMLEFPALDRIVSTGYAYATETLARLRESGELAALLPPGA